MAEFNKINLFGSLTSKQGYALKFEDFDKDGDGKITEREIKKVKREDALDKVDFTKIDTDENKSVSKEEFAKWEQLLSTLDEETLEYWPYHMEEIWEKAGKHDIYIYEDDKWIKSQGNDNEEQKGSHK